MKNKLFFFGDYQGTREVRGVSQNQVVPSALEKTGDFSDLADTGFAQFNTQAQDPNNPDGTITVPTTVRGDSSPENFANTLTQRLGYNVSPGRTVLFLAD